MSIFSCLLPAATADLLEKYWLATVHAWQQRSHSDDHRRGRNDAEFLPAALELIETPPSPAPRLAALLIVAFVLLTIAWSVVGRLDVMATARGKIVPGSGSKIVQSAETAVVRSIHVKDGQAVSAGDVLVELDASLQDADRRRVGIELDAARLQVARATALLHAIDRRSKPQLSPMPGIEAERLEREQHLLVSQFEEFRSKLARFDADIARRSAELDATRQVIAKLEQTVPIARRRARDFAELVERNFISEHGWLDKEQSRIEQEGDLAMQRARLGELTAGLTEGMRLKDALVAETRRIALDSRTEGEQHVTALTQEGIKAETRSRRMTLTAPVDGTVQQVAIHTEGGVVTEAQALMIVVPREDVAEIEVMVDNKDIGFVHAGQTASVKFDTFPFTRYGTIRASVSHVSADAVSDERKGLAYVARLQLTRPDIEVDGESVRLLPGMAVSAEIRTGSRRVIEYFLSPLMQRANESLRER